MSSSSIHPDFRLNEKKYTQKELLELAKKLKQSTEEYEQDFGQLILDWLNESAFITVQTSGTTGKPKSIEISKNQMINSANATAEHFGLQPKQKALLCMPTKYIAGKMMLVRAMVIGLDLDVVAPTSTPLQNTKKHYDFTAMVPLQVKNSLSQLNRVKKLIIGGAKLDNDLRNQLLPLALQCFETYGMTETITHIAAKKINEKYFSALPNVVFSTDSRECLTIDAPKVAATIVVTNDVVKLIDKTHFEWLGRADNVINSGGVKIFPEKVEEKLSQKISQRFFIAALPDQRLGEKVVLIIEGENQKMNEDAFENLHRFERPKEIIFVKKFEETPTRKIKRKLIIDTIIDR